MSTDAAEVLKRSSEVDAFLAQKNKSAALAASLQNPPVNADKEIKVQSAEVVEKALLSFSEADIAPALATLSSDQLDLLMKYVYRLMEKEKASPASALILKLHAQLVEKAGVGSIMRALVERKTV